MKRLTVRALLSLTCLAAAGCQRGTPPRGTTPPPSGNTAAKAPPQTGTADRQQAEDRIRAVVARVLQLQPAEVDVSVPLSKQKVAADELDVVEIVMEVEEAFGVEIAEEEISSPSGELRADLSVRKLAEIVAAKRGRR